MKKVLIPIIVVLLFTACNDDPSLVCSTNATIRDLTGLDGCGFVFELEDGSYLEPVLPLLLCGTPPLPKEVTEDPLYNFEFVDGKRVVISYEETEGVSICMVGLIVKITCIREAPAYNPEDD